MRRFFCSLLVAALVGGMLQSVASARIWSDATGSNKVDAEYVGKKDGRVILRKRDGSLATVPIERLSAEDQKHVADLPDIVAPTVKPEPVEEAAPVETDRFTKAIEQNPNDHSAYYTRGMARLNQGRHSEAMTDFNKSIQLSPEFAPAYDGRGVALSKTGKPLQAHADFDKAVELDPELASAYRHRGDNVKGLWDSPQGKELLKDRAESYREKYEKARSSNLTNTPWQPLNTTAGNVLPALTQMRQVDYLRAREIEEAYGGGVDGGGYSGGGLAIGNGGVKIVNGGLTVVNPGTTIVGNPPLSVYPEEVVQGQTVTLVANPAELSKAMPVQLGPNGKPIRRKGAYGNVPREPVYAVDFYRDVDGDGLLNADQDEYLASDNNGKDGFTAEVSTAAFPPGNQAYFAMGRGQQPAGVPSTYGQAAEAVKKAVTTERDIAEASESAAASSGYTVEQAQDLRNDQKQIAENTAKMAQAFQQTAPQAAQALAGASKAMEAVDTRLDAAEKRPGVATIAEGAASKAKEAADLLDQAYAKLAERAQGEEEGKGSPSPAAPAGAAAVASGKVKPATPGPAQTAGTPGKPGPGNPGNGDGDYGGDDDNSLARADDGDIDINIRDRDRDDYDGDRDININIDDDRDVRKTIDKALGYIEDDDYDRAVLEYDRYLVDGRVDTDVLEHRADAYVHRGSYDYAVRDYTDLIDLNVKSADLYYNRGCAHLAAGRLEDAIVDFNASIELDETRNLAYTNLGTALARQGKYASAIDQFATALKINSNDTLALRNQALAYKKMGELDKYEANLVRVRELTIETSGE